MDVAVDLPNDRPGPLQSDGACGMPCAPCSRRHAKHCKAAAACEEELVGERGSPAGGPSSCHDPCASARSLGALGRGCRPEAQHKCPVWAAASNAQPRNLVAAEKGCSCVGGYRGFYPVKHPASLWTAMGDHCMFLCGSSIKLTSHRPARLRLGGSTLHVHAGRGGGGSGASLDVKVRIV